MKQRTTIFISPSTVKRAKAQAIQDGISFSQLAEKAIESCLPTIVKVKIYKEDGQKYQILKTKISKTPTP